MTLIGVHGPGDCCILSEAGLDPGLMNAPLTFCGKNRSADIFFLPMRSPGKVIGYPQDDCQEEE
jgi:hypothetical protein